MFSKRIELLRQNTAVDLTLRFALLFLLSAVVLYFTVEYLLSGAQLEKDQQQISSFIESYQRLEQQAGLHKLELVIERDEPYFQRSAMWVQLTTRDKQIIMNVHPESWSGIDNNARIRLDGWREVGIINSPQRVLYQEVELADGITLTIGQSDADRIAQLSRYRELMLQIMSPLLLFGLALTAYMNWKSLRPVHDLISTVRSLKPLDLKARVIIRDSKSELGELAQLFNQKLNQIERLILGMQQSLDAVSHDLRTPLARMRLSIEAAIIQADNIDALKEALSDSAEESRRMETMLNTLLDISEAESGILNLHPQQVDAGELFEKIIELYQYAAEDRGMNLVVVPGEQLFIKADPVRLQQILGNLIDNALKYSQANSSVWLSWYQSENSVILEVKDEGEGISKSDQDRVFDRLFRADKSRTKPGMGLGLSLVKAIVEAHGGTISLQSELNNGCCIRVMLPKAERSCEP